MNASSWFFFQGGFMSRKVKTRKYIPRNEFRYNNSPKAQGHPHYVFGETKTHYKSLGLTSTPKQDVPYYPLTRNPEQNNLERSYLQLDIHSANKKYYEKPLQGWSFAKDDMPVVRHTIKKYKKSTNRKPKLWYEKKRKWNKKNKK